MNEINLNALNRSLGVGRALSAAANQKNDSIKSTPVGSDSVEFSHLPDFSKADHAVEAEFASRRSSLQDTSDSALYPPLETIDKLAAMLAIDLRPNQK